MLILKLVVKHESESMYVAFSYNQKAIQRSLEVFSRNESKEAILTPCKMCNLD